MSQHQAIKSSLNLTTTTTTKNGATNKCNDASIPYSMPLSPLPCMPGFWPGLGLWSPTPPRNQMFALPPFNQTIVAPPVPFPGWTQAMTPVLDQKSQAVVDADDRRWSNFLSEELRKHNNERRMFYYYKRRDEEAEQIRKDFAKKRRIEHATSYGGGSEDVVPEGNGEIAGNADSISKDNSVPGAAIGGTTVLRGPRITGESTGEVAEPAEIVSGEIEVASHESGKNEDVGQCKAADETSVEEGSHGAGIDDAAAGPENNSTSTFAVARRDFDEYCIELETRNRELREEYAWLDSEVQRWHGKYRDALRFGNPTNGEDNANGDDGENNPYGDDYEPFDNAPVADEIVEPTDDVHLRYIKGYVSYVIKHQRVCMVLEAKNEQLESKIQEWKDKYEAIASIEMSSSSATQENSRLAGNRAAFQSNASIDLDVEATNA